jgi:alpha-tubulin suppressor-like RCC1 family protein
MQLRTDWYQFRPVEEQVKLSEITHPIAAAREHSLAMRSDGTLWAWGSEKKIINLLLLVMVCNKRRKKLLTCLTGGQSPLPALSAITTYTDIDLSNVKVFGLNNIPLYVTGQALVKFNDLATSEIYQVVMLTGCLYLIMMMPLIEMKLSNQTQPLECLQGALDGRETQT